MKPLIAAILLLSLHSVRAGEVILPYSAFGPQAAAHELIGMEWWQWDPHGDSRPQEYLIQVVVYWDQSREDTARRHPVDRDKLQDFRYVEYSKAVTHMEKTIREFKAAALDPSPIEQGLAQLRKEKAKQATPPNSDQPSP